MNIYTRNLDRIEFDVTMGCTGKCRHCSEGTHDLRGGHIDGNIAAGAVREVCRYYNIKSLMTFGGESLLYPDDVCKIHQAAENAAFSALQQYGRDADPGPLDQNQPLPAAAIPASTFSSALPHQSIPQHRA